jgi:hypothetical protein
MLEESIQIAIALVRVIISKTKRANSSAFHDETNYSESIIDEANGDANLLQEELLSLQ